MELFSNRWRLLSDNSKLASNCGDTVGPDLQLMLKQEPGFKLIKLEEDDLDLPPQDPPSQPKVNEDHVTTSEAGNAVKPDIEAETQMPLTPAPSTTESGENTVGDSTETKTTEEEKPEKTEAEEEVCNRQLDCNIMEKGPACLDLSVFLKTDASHPHYYQNQQDLSHTKICNFFFSTICYMHLAPEFTPLTNV